MLSYAPSFIIRGLNDLPGINATYSDNDGHLYFNGVRYETEEQLTAFHKDFGFSNEGVLSGLGAVLLGD